MNIFKRFFSKTTPKRPVKIKEVTFVRSQVTKSSETVSIKQFIKWFVKETIIKDDTLLIMIPSLMYSDQLVQAMAIPLTKQQLTSDIYNAKVLYMIIYNHLNPTP